MSGSGGYRSHRGNGSSTRAVIIANLCRSQRRGRKRLSENVAEARVATASRLLQRTAE